MRFLLTLLVLFCSVVPVRRAQSAAALERGTAITAPLSLRELDRGKFGLGHVLLPMRSADAPITNSQLFALPSMLPIHKALDEEFERYVARHQADQSGETIGIGNSHDVQLFDRALLDAPDSRFVLAGIVNRMDRAYLAEATCAEIARRLLATANSPLAGARLAEQLLAKDGPLDLIEPGNIDLIETNLQIAHMPKSATRDFRTDYLLKVFRYNAQKQVFEQAPLENQIDRERLVADENLKRDFRAWLLDPQHIGELDRGTILIPEKFLATAAIAATPAGFAASNLQPAFGLVQGDGAAADAVFRESDVVTALKKAAGRGESLQNIRSVAGFERRLNDVTCAGCHQTRGIGGFHFPGVDWMAAHPSNSTVVPASPQFFGDQIRRRDILASLRDGRRPDYSRGFSSRPQLRGSTELAGTEYDDGWGAHCYRQKPDAADNDQSFRTWTCAEGLACQVVGTASRMGMCFVKNR